VIEKIICHLVDRASESNYFEKIFPFARIITNIGVFDNKQVIQSKPAQYNGNGQLDDVTIFDNKNGTAYFRMNGKLNISSPVNNGVPCDDELKFAFPIRFVGCVQKSKLSKDDAFSEERMSQSLINKLSFKKGSLTKDLQAISVTFIPSSVTFDGYTIASEEYRNRGITTFNFNFAYIAIDFTASVVIKINCLQNEC
jgi:hypothetical protein